MIEVLLQAERSLTVGQLDAAERLYRQAFQADPRNSIAVVGLARVALDRGEDREAYRLASQALGIDSENAAAQRLVSRLDEVMRHRGEEPPAVPTPAAQPGQPPTSASAPPAQSARQAKPKRGLLGRLLGR